MTDMNRMNDPKKIDPALQKRLHAIAAQPEAQTNAQSQARRRHIAALKDCRDRLLQTPAQRFQSGDLVRYRRHMRITDLPAYGEVMVVVEVLPEPLFITDTPTSGPYYQMPVDVVLGTVREGALHCWHFDSRRFEKVSETA